MTLIPFSNAKRRKHRLDRLQFANGMLAHVSFVALHRRHRRGVYTRPTDGLACAGRTIAWGRTRREAFARLVELTGALRAS